MSKHGNVGSPFYVGKGSGKRAFSRRGKNDRLMPRDNKNIVIVKEGLSEAEAFALEISLIAQFGRIDLSTGCLYNRTNGGDGCTRIKGLKGKPKPPRTVEHCWKLGAHLRGKKQSPELIEKRMAKMKGRKRPPFSEEWKRRISEAKLSRPTSAGVGHPKGMPAWNKGTKGVMKANSTSFQKGLIPWNKRAE